MNKKEKTNFIFYDGQCRMCIAWTTRAKRVLRNKSFSFIPLQDSWAKEKLGLKDDKDFVEMKLLTADDDVLGGMDALIYLSRHIWWTWPLYAVSHIPGIKVILKKFYRWMARNRYCLGGRCDVTFH